ncbi:MAG: thiamine phosphate synthase [Gammaproteobacteria bacterium]|nr:thiamine phosphate synthase [Gammaproteobacteria bacterium]
MLSGLYAITDQTLISDQNFANSIAAALKGGAKVVQYRDKSSDHKRRQQQAKTLVRLCRQYQALSIINDDIELAFEVEADGVHLGLEDRNLKQARNTLGPQAIIGITCYDSLQRAKQAEQQGANYVAFGRFFPSQTKPNAHPAPLSLLQQARQELKLPICAIGGITQHNAQPLLTAGADMLAVVGGIFAGKNIEQQSRQFKALF